MGVQAISRVRDYTKDRRSALGKLTGLYKDFQKLSAHPVTGSASPSLPQNDYLKAPDKHGSLLGSLIVESTLGTTFFEAANDVISEASGEDFSTIDFDPIIDAADEYYEDRFQDDRRYKKGAGKGTNALLHGYSEAASPALYDDADAWDAYYSDAPERTSLEASMASTLRDLAVLDALEHAPLAALQ